MKSLPYDVETGLEETADSSIGACSTKTTTISLDGGGKAMTKTLSRAFLSSGMPVTFKVSQSVSHVLSPRIHSFLFTQLIT